MLTRVFPPLKGYIDEVKGMKLDGAQMDTREALALRAEVADRGLHVVAWMIDMWVVSFETQAVGSARDTRTPGLGVFQELTRG